jgi:tRNA G18 (ribose-2'-O)-methylase SpoU
MRGYFGIGVQEISKEQNVGNLVRSAHAFGASFFFTIAPVVDVRAMRQSDTSGAFDHVPYFQYQNVEELSLPKGCQLVGIEFVEESIDLPSFSHPTRAAYVLGPEMGSLSPELLSRCDHVVKIPMKFCVNVGVAGALVMYDRMISQKRFAARPVAAGGPAAQKPLHTQGGRRRMSRKK